MSNEKVYKPVTLTVDDLLKPREWTMVKCDECHNEFPITEYCKLLYGSTGWICPRM